ncbi:MAG: right-handed parallel beta-helix repeat-containing protein [Methanothrix sp.]
MSLIVAIILFIGSEQSATIKVNSNDTIQGAIDKAREGDLIEVQSGTYYENIDVNKRIDLKGIGNPIVDAGKKGNGITISANGIVLEGFTIVNAEDSGINVISNNNNTIKANIVSGNRLCGVNLYNCSNNTLSNNIPNITNLV